MISTRTSRLVRSPDRHANDWCSRVRVAGAEGLVSLHRPRVVEHTSHHIAVTYLGEVIEIEKRDLFTRPQHPCNRDAPVGRPGP
jgi:hypothetical protein